MSPLKVILDEMYAGLKVYLEVLGWSVSTVQNFGLGGASDKEVVEYARDHGFLLVIQDQRPADLADLLGVRNVYISNADVARIVDSENREKYAESPHQA